MEGYTFTDWLNGSTNRTLKDLLLSAKVYPFISEDDEWAEDEYLKRKYFFQNEFIPEIEPQGLAAAAIYQTLCISLSTHEYWKNEKLTIHIIDEHLEGVLLIKDVFNVSDQEDFENAVIQDFIGEITTPVLLTTELLASQKKIQLRDDHGKDKLEKFGKRLLQSPYVIEVINSIPFNPKATNLIRRTRVDGKIELVMYWEDKGYGLIIQTTGRNIHETNAIAEILIDEYDN